MYIECLAWSVPKCALSSLGRDILPILICTFWAYESLSLQSMYIMGFK